MKKYRLYSLPVFIVLFLVFNGSVSYAKCDGGWEVRARVGDNVTLGNAKGETRNVMLGSEFDGGIVTSDELVCDPSGASALTLKAGAQDSVAQRVTVADDQESRIRVERQRADALSMELSQKYEDIKNLKTSLEKAKADNAILWSQQKKIALNLAEAEKENGRQSDQIKAKDSKIVTLTDNNSKLDAELKRVAAELLVKDGNNKTLAADIDGTNKENSHLLSEVNELNGQLVALKAKERQFDAMADTNAKLKEGLGDMEKRLTALQSSLNPVVAVQTPAAPVPAKHSQSTTRAEKKREKAKESAHKNAAMESYKWERADIEGLHGVLYADDGQSVILKVANNEQAKAAELLGSAVQDKKETKDYAYFTVSKQMVQVQQ